MQRDIFPMAVRAAAGLCSATSQFLTRPPELRTQMQMIPEPKNLLTAQADTTRKSRLAICLTPFWALVAVMLLATVAAAPAALPIPATPTAAATGIAGEVEVSWPAVASAQFYTVGWINRNDYQEISGRNGDWRSAFHYATVTATSTSYVVSGLKAGEEYWTIVGARTVRVGGDDPSWSEWSSLVTTAGQHGEGFCPITGLPLPPGGYLSPGTSASDSGGTRFTLNSVTVKATVRLDGENYRAPSGQKFIRVCASVKATPDYAFTFLFGRDYNVDTDTGLGFVIFDDGTNNWLDVGDIPAGSTRTACDVWLVSATSQTVIVAYNKFLGDPALYKVDLP